MSDPARRMQAEVGLEFPLIEAFGAGGFEIERLAELQAPADAETHGFYDYVTADWARKWPAEEIWVARKTD